MQEFFKTKMVLIIIMSQIQMLTCNFVISNEQKIIVLKDKNEISIDNAKNIINIKKFTHSYGFSFETAYYHYLEPDVMQKPLNNTYGAHWVTWRGNSWGGSTFYKLTWKDSIFLQPEVRMLYGKHQYNYGQKKKTHSKTNHSIPSLIFEPRLTLGGYLQIYKGLTLSPYSGIGYRFKSDDGEDIRTSRGNKLGFYRKSNYIYVPLGASAEYKIDNTWSVSLKGEYDWIVKAWHYSRTLTSGSKIFTQPNGYGLKGEFSIGYLYKKVKVSLTPYINYWNVRNSKRAYFMRDGYRSSSREPYNISWETGLKLGATF